MKKAHLNIYVSDPPIRKHVKTAIERARRFQKKAFPGRTLPINSATLIAQARKERVRK
jgi:hypothetical protein